MGLIDKREIEDIKKTVTEKVDDYKKEINQKTKIDRFDLAFRIGTEKHRTGGFTDEQYNIFCDKLLESMGFDVSAIIK